jgi:acyl dehydratase
MIEMTPENSTKIQQEIDKLVGQVGEPDSVPVDLVSVVRLGLAVDDLDPIHYDADAADARGYRGIVAPWPILSFLRYNCKKLEETEYSFGRVTVHGEDSYDFAEPIIVGDVITVTTSITGGTVKQGRSGLLALVTSERRYTNQLGQFCAVMRTIGVRR